MRAGKLDKTITIERATEMVDANGVFQSAWATVATVRAQLIEASSEEFFRDQGAAAETVAVFRLWFLDGITVADRVRYAGRVYNIKQVKELGRRQGLELRTVTADV
jgi:SPP1 family predicted phage head-tail adaptor